MSVVWAGTPLEAQGEAYDYVFLSDGAFLNAELVSRGFAVRDTATGDEDVGSYDGMY